MTTQKQNPAGGPGLARSQALGNGLQADHRLCELLRASLALPGQHVNLTVEGAHPSPELWAITKAIAARCRELGGRPQVHLGRALAAIGGGQ